MSGQNYDPSLSMLSNKVPSEASRERIHAYIRIQCIYMYVRLDLGQRVYVEHTSIQAHTSTYDVCIQ